MIPLPHCRHRRSSNFLSEAGDPNQTSLLLLHGFPSSSHMFRNLIPLLADRFHIVAPDLPGFGFSQSPPRSQFKYTFDNLAKVIEAFTEVVRLQRYALYVFDYGAPVGFRLAVAHPERVTAIVSQNGNAYEEGLSVWSYWAKPTTENRKALRDALLTYEGTRWQYTHGVSNPEAVAPESYTLDAVLLERPGNKDIQLDLFLNYASNLAPYPVFRSTFATPSRRCLPSGRSMTLSFCRPAPRRIAVIIPMPLLSCWIPDISRSKRTSSKSRRQFTD
jgi:pimeloyl-ACP methyl ester carboxylesterase